MVGPASPELYLVNYSEDLNKLEDKAKCTLAFKFADVKRDDFVDAFKAKAKDLTFEKQGKVSAVP